MTSGVAPTRHARSALSPSRATGRFIASGTLGAITWACLTWLPQTLIAWPVRALATWDVASLTLSALSWTIILRADASETKRRAGGDDPGRYIVFIIALVASLISLFTAAVVLHTGKGAEVPAWTVLTLAAVALSWAVTHTVYAFRYAHLYLPIQPGRRHELGWWPPVLWPGGALGYRFRLFRLHDRDVLPGVGRRRDDTPDAPDGAGACRVVVRLQHDNPRAGLERRIRAALPLAGALFSPSIEERAPGTGMPPLSCTDRPPSLDSSVKPTMTVSLASATGPRTVRIPDVGTAVLNGSRAWSAKPPPTASGQQRILTSSASPWSARRRISARASLATLPSGT